MNQEPTQLLASPRQFGIQLSATPRGARLARLLAVAQLHSWELEAVSGPAAQIVAELAANAVTHGRVPGRDFRLGLLADEDRLRIEVTDTRSDRLPVASGGYGLVLVEALSGNWGVRQGPVPRKTVWAELPLPRAAATEGSAMRAATP
ncbi:ATP-binding protein [Streptomyces sp. NPDC048018]|uniref:ATP-binding protein n=1 Tax=Streptomyces sp. NPDC048018 TaxID=3365499 RepID=UPI003722A77E